MKTVSAASIPGRSSNTWFAKLRAAASHAITLHLQYCELLAEAHRRKY
jgi:hypothetical protein